MNVRELRVLLRSADQKINRPSMVSDDPNMQVMIALQGIGISLLVLADLAVTKLEREEKRTP